MSADLTKTIETYCAAWTEPDADKRAALLAGSVSSDVLYVDPTASVSGVAALGDHIAGVIASLPGARLEVTSGVDRHHQFARFGWRMIRGDGSPLADSVDFVEIDDDGQLCRITGFFGALPPSENG
jgi:hypothetical protein